ncbi:hypothetical protein BC940DRAFT_293266, partial [Gongronella butleri]
MLFFFLFRLFFMFFYVFFLFYACLSRVFLVCTEKKVTCFSYMFLTFFSSTFAFSGGGVLAFWFRFQLASGLFL